MASGYGYSGGTARCHSYWMEFQKCFNSADAPQQCSFQAEDYLECIHHRKEIARARRIKEEYVKKQLHDQEQGRHNIAQAASKGLIGALGLIPPQGSGHDANEKMAA